MVLFVLVKILENPSFTFTIAELMKLLTFENLSQTAEILHEQEREGMRTKEIETERAAIRQREREILAAIMGD